MADEKPGPSFRGPRGKRGHRGRRGHQGHRGHEGVDGSTGATGANGAGGTGATGATGAPGTPGTGADFAMAFIGNSEGPFIVSEVNVSSVNFAAGVTTLTLTAPVPSTDNAILSVTLFSPTNPPEGVYAIMTDTTHVEIRIIDVAANPTFTAFYFRLALVP